MDLGKVLKLIGKNEIAQYGILKVNFYFFIFIDILKFFI
jgi:hypothetical protein